MSTYAALVALARREGEAIEEGRWEELAALQEEWSALLAGLPGLPPPEARPHLAEAERVIRANAAALEAALSSARAALARLGHERRALRSYAGGRLASSLETRG